ncbi:hypothetical protein CVT24_010395 [Panaeolus cyanescens]|uniref:Copper transport protein n=1 Tax=Panaeolus cyanescens TaxID=181874 RepID=A0A409W938_9AGAR|nr:hypothetical protein CVT24_010395 [Panaeolus cyanescens]
MALSSSQTRPGHYIAPILVLASILTLALAQHVHDTGDPDSVVTNPANGLDPTMDMPMDLASGHGMMAFLHFTPGDTIWFEGWVPTSPGAIGGTCVGMFLLALVERWLSAMRGMAELYWRNRARIEHANRLNAVSTKEADRDSLAHAHRRGSPMMNALRLRSIPPFVWSHDIARGVMHAAQAALGFLMMLTVMTYNVAFILSLVIGLGVGETLFGRYATMAGH